MRRISITLAIALSSLLLISTCSAQQTSAQAVPKPIRHNATLKDTQDTKQDSSPSEYQGTEPGSSFGRGATNYVPIWLNPVMLGNSAIYQTGGNVGIGTTTPVTTLDVNGSINAATTYGIDRNPVMSIGSLEDYNLFLGVLAGANNVAGQGKYNTFSGDYAGFNNTTGRFNTFSGAAAGYANTTGGDNTFSGFAAGRSNTEGNSNTFSGYGAGSANTTGHDNTFSGYAAGIDNSTGSFNTFFGSQAGLNNTTGQDNVFSGSYAGYSNITGQGNLFSGSYAGYRNTTGQGNVFSGTYAGYSNTTGGGNTFYGAGAGYNNNGDNNIFYGVDAGYYNKTGSHDIYIGNPGSDPGTESFTIRIGDPEFQNAAYIAGVYGAVVGGGVPMYIGSNGRLGTHPSSLRFKEQVRDMGDSTNALMKLRPVTFLYKPEYANGERTLQYGLIAEEVAEVYPELVAYDNDGQPYTVRYQHLAPMLLNEVQKQYHRAEAEAKVITAQEEKIEQLEQRLSRLEGLVREQVRTVAHGRE